MHLWYMSLPSTASSRYSNGAWCACRCCLLDSHTGPHKQLGCIIGHCALSRSLETTLICRLHLIGGECRRHGQCVILTHYIILAVTNRACCHMAVTLGNNPRTTPMPARLQTLLSCLPAGIPCVKGYFSFNSFDSECTMCLPNAQCPGGSTLWPKPGLCLFVCLWVTRGGGLRPAGHTQRNQANPTAGVPALHTCQLWGLAGCHAMPYAICSMALTHSCCSPICLPAICHSELEEEFRFRDLSVCQPIARR